MRRKMLATLATLILAAPLWAAGGERWIHIRVDEGADGDRVMVNVPLSLVEQILPAIHLEPFNGGRVRIEGGDLDDVDVKAIWQALRVAKDGEFVRVKSRSDGDVRVSKAGGMMLVSVEEPGDDGERIRIRMPVRFLDALFAPGGGELDVVAAIETLAEAPDGDLVTVEGGDERVRIWVDHEAAPAE